MNFPPSTPRRRAAPHWGPLVSVGLLVAAPAAAHDGHAPLPSKGATVQGEQLLLSDPARRALGVNVAKVELADLARVIRAQARVQLPWDQQAIVTTLIPGRIEQVLVRPGDRVEAGQALAFVEGLELETHQREWLRALADRALAEKLLAQGEGLARSSAIPVVELLRARRDADEAAARGEVALRKLLSLGLVEADLEEARAAGTPVRRLAITSPIAGEVVHADVRAGQVVATDEHLFHVVDLSAVEVAGMVLEADLPLVAVGQAVSVSVTSFPGERFGGRVEHMYLGIEPATRALTVLARGGNSGRELRPGMSGLMEIRVAETPQAVVCPAAALAGTPSAPFALVERAPGRYERRRVRVGSRSEGRAEILDGLFPGDRVVVAGVGLMAGLFPSQATRQPGGPVAGGWASAAIVAQGEVELPVGRRRFASSQVVGKVARIMAHPGDTVREGQVLAELESLALRDLQLDLLLAVSRLRWERDSVSRLRQLAEDQAAARVELWRAENELALTEQTIGEIRSKLLSLGLDAEALGRLEEGGLDARSRGEAIAPTIPVRAPADGQLAHFEIVPGQVVGPSGPDRATAATLLFEVQDRARVWVKVYVRERDAASIREGQPAEVSFPALPGVSAAGEVVRVSPVFEGAARVLPVWVEVDNPAGKLFEGMQARASLGPGPGARIAHRRGPN